MSDLKNPGTPQPPAKEAAPATEVSPPWEDCRTSPYLPAFSKCLADHPTCRYLRPFGYSKFCVHPDHVKFSTRD